MNIKIGEIIIVAWVETHRTIEYNRKGVPFKRRIKLKKPIAKWGSSFDITIDECFKTGSIFVDEFDNKFGVVISMFITKQFSLLKPVKYLNEGKLQLSTKLELISSSVGEKSLT